MACKVGRSSCQVAQSWVWGRTASTFLQGPTENYRWQLISLHPFSQQWIHDLDLLIQLILKWNHAEPVAVKTAAAIASDLMLATLTENSLSRVNNIFLQIQFAGWLAIIDVKIQNTKVNKMETRCESRSNQVNWTHETWESSARKWCAQVWNHGPLTTNKHSILIHGWDKKRTSTETINIKLVENMHCWVSSWQNHVLMHHLPICLLTTSRELCSTKIWHKIQNHILSFTSCYGGCHSPTSTSTIQ